jgi:hypothetical protein
VTISLLSDHSPMEMNFPDFTQEENQVQDPQYHAETPWDL